MKKELKYHIKMAAALLIMCAGILIVMSATAYASTAVRTDASDIEALDGELGYIKRAHLYYLDMEKTEMLDFIEKALNYIANLIFTLIRWVGQCVCMIFYYCMNFNLAEMFESEIGEIQKALRSSIFEPLFLLAFSGSAIIILKKLLRRDMMGSFGQILKVIGILILSFWIIRDSGTAITATTGITKSISCEALTGMAGMKSTSVASYAANAAGTLWNNLIHQPWKYIEFGDDPVSDADIDGIWLKYQSGDPERDAAVAAYTGEAFKKSRAGERLGFMLLYLIPFIIKSVIYIVMSVMSLVFQLEALLWLFMAPIVLLLALLPGYDGIISIWLRKMLEAQLSILTMSFIIGLLVKVDDILYAKGGKAWGWLLVLIIQTVLNVFVIIKRNELLGAFSSLGVHNPAARINQSLHAGKQAAKSVTKAGAVTGDLTTRGIAATGKKTAEISKTAFSAGKISRETAIMEAASGYQIAGQYRQKKKVERPMMADMPAAAGAEGKIIPYPGAAAKSRSVSAAESSAVSTQNAARSVKRPRMDQIPTTSVKTAYSGAGNAVRLEISGEQRSAAAERPVLSPGTAATAGHSDTATAPKRQRQENAASGSAAEKAKQTASAQIRKDSAAERARDSQGEKSRPVKRPQSSVPPEAARAATPRKAAASGTAQGAAGNASGSAADAVKENIIRAGRKVK